jgi:hypothetical protein
MGKNWLLQCAFFQHEEHVDSLMCGEYLQYICAAFSIDVIQFDCFFANGAERNSLNFEWLKPCTFNIQIMEDSLFIPFNIFSP